MRWLYLGCTGILALGCTSGGGSADDGVWVPPIDGSWRGRGDPMDRVLLNAIAGPDAGSDTLLFGTASMVSVTWQGDGQPVTGTLEGTKLRFPSELAARPDGMCTISFLNESQLSLDCQPGETYQKTFVPDLTTGLWCELGGSSRWFTVQDSEINPGDDPDSTKAYAFSGFAPGNVKISGTLHTPDLTHPDPASRTYTARVELDLPLEGKVQHWTGKFRGVSTIELSGEAGALRLERRRAGDTCK